MEPSILGEIQKDWRVWNSEVEPVLQQVAGRSGERNHRSQS
jgi:hypothetical protein